MLLRIPASRGSDRRQLYPTPRKNRAQRQSDPISGRKLTGAQATPFKNCRHIPPVPTRHCWDHHQLVLPYSGNVRLHQPRHRCPPQLHHHPKARRRLRLLVPWSSSHPFPQLSQHLSPQSNRHPPFRQHIHHQLPQCSHRPLQQTSLEYRLLLLSGHRWCACRILLLR